MTLLADVNRAGSQEDLVSNWEPAHSLVEDASLLDGDCPLTSGSGCLMPASLPLGREGPIWQLSYSLLVFVQSFVL